jgi:hypothetical protein
MGKLSKLFRWNKKVEIKQGGKVYETVYIRLVSDPDFQEARTYALKRSKELRTQLRDKNSEEYRANFLDLDVLNKEELIIGATVGEMPNYRDEAMFAVPEKEAPVLPDEATLEQMEEHEALLEERKKSRVKEIADYIEKKVEERRKQLDTLTIEELRNIYMSSIINMRCTEMFTRIFREYQVFRGVFDDAKFTKPSFDSFDEFENSAPQLKAQLMNSYTDLEISGEELKN